MTWPQRFPDRPSGSQFGWRTFQGKQTFHYGRDQPAGVGAIHRAHADGKVLVHGHDRVYGFYLVVEYSGAPGVRHHIHQLQDRGRAPGAGNFKKGDQLGIVGDPLLNIPVSERFNHATYCGSTFSTGPHSHEEVRTATQIDAAIDPAGTQASNIWKTIEATQGDELDASQSKKLDDIHMLLLGGTGGVGLPLPDPVGMGTTNLAHLSQYIAKGVQGFETTAGRAVRNNVTVPPTAEAIRDQVWDGAKFPSPIPADNKALASARNLFLYSVQRLATGGVSGLSDADLLRIKDAVADELAKRLGS